jgi:sorting nexin-9/18/33
LLAGEVLTVSDQNVGNGWWEGINAQGKRGIFPASCKFLLLFFCDVIVCIIIVSCLSGLPTDVEEATTPSRPVAPPMPPPQSTLYSNDFPSTDDPWSQPDPVVPPSFTEAQQPRYDDAPYDDFDDSDFDDDESRYGAPAHRPAGGYSANLPPVPGDSHSIASSNLPLTRKTSKMFSKSSDSYIMGTSSPTVPESEQVNIYLNDQGMYYWKPLETRYVVTVTSPKMESKFKGMKKFIAYQLQSNFSNEPVSRRYKNFDWLHERLVEKYCLIPIPPLPDKQISGRYEDQFIEHRRAQLQQFVDWVCRHPILSKSDVWMHFLTCKDVKKWKAGKRAAEKDPVRVKIC